MLQREGETLWCQVRKASAEESVKGRELPSRNKCRDMVPQPSRAQTKMETWL